MADLSEKAQKILWNAVSAVALTGNADALDQVLQMIE
jgi:hypothetical protein